MKSKTIAVLGIQALCYLALWLVNREAIAEFQF